jgi:methionyl-tRNA formyltransferase
MRIVFLGSPAFALPTLQALIDSPHEIVAVVTQPDRPAGRGHASTPPPVKQAALAAGLTVLQPERVSDVGSVEQLRALEPDVTVVAAYGQILRQRFLDMPKRGSLNVHASLLPRHRGASPVAAAILAGDAVTGVTIMEIVRALDAGPMVAKVEETILDSDTTGSLEVRLAKAGAAKLIEVLEPWAAGLITPTQQDETLATYAPMLKREDALIDWSRPAVEIWRQVRAFNPWPIAYTSWQGEMLRILEASPTTGYSGKPPGTALSESAAGVSNAGKPSFAVQTGDGLLLIAKLQRAGKRPLSAAEFLRGQRDILGQRLGA